MRIQLSIPFASPRQVKLAGQLSLLALAAGLGAGCSMVPLREPIFTGSTSNQQEIIAAKRSGAPGAGAFAGAPTAGVQGGDLPAPPGASVSAPAPYTPPKPYAAKGLPTPVGQVGSVAPPEPRPAPDSPTLVSMGSKPTTLNEQAGLAGGKGGGTYTVQSGDTMYNIAQRHGVSVDKLIAANGGSQTAKLGGRLTIPGGGSAPNVQVASVDPKSVPIPAPAPAPTAAPAVASAAEIVPMGQAIAAPAAGTLTPPAMTPPAVTAPAAAASIAGAPPTPAPPPQELALAPQTGAAGAAAPESPKPAAASGFRWPVRGKVISGFGKKPDGERNDGINLAVPEGTAVKAAEDGTVIYSGNELKSYGNLVLIRHTNGWVSAYAHNSELKVKRGDQVRRGEVVSLSGMSGGVTTPQVHFELRKEATPVDPLQHMNES